MLKIQNDRTNANNDEVKKVPFRDIVKVSLPAPEVKDSLPRGWKEGFMLQTRERLFILGARCEDDRNMWIAGFRYIIASTVTVQNLMRENDLKVERKLKKVTEKMHATGVIDIKTGNQSIGRSSYEDKQEEFNKLKKSKGL